MATTDYTNGTIIESAWLNDVDAFIYQNVLPAALEDYADDAAAASGGIALYGFYRNGSVVMQRVA